MRAVLLLFCLLGPDLAAQRRKGAARETYLYTYFDREGRILMDTRPPGFMEGRGLTLQHVVRGVAKPLLTSRQFQKVVRSPELLALVERICAQEGVDPWLAKAVIQAESAFNFNARSHAGAMGLMQLMPATARRFGVTDPFHPEQNITGGVKYLRWLDDHFRGDKTKVVAAYNAGEGAVKRYGGVPPFAETRAYVPKVLGLWQGKSVVPRADAKGGMELLKKGHGGFLVNEEKLRKAMAAAGPAEGASSAQPAQQFTPDPPSPIYRWRDAKGQLNITNDPPPPGAREVTDRDR